MEKSNKAIFVTAGFASAFLFGAATPVSKALLDSVQPQTLAGLLYLGSALGVLPVVVKETTFRWPWKAGRRTFFLLAGAMAMGGAMGPLLILLGLRAVSAGSVSLWLNLEFVATAILGHFVFKEYMTLRGWIAAAGTLIASLLLAGVEGVEGILPVVLIACGCVCWGFDNHFTALIDGIPPSQTTFWKGIFAGAFNLLMGSIISGVTGRPAAVCVALIVGVVSYGISITLYVTAAQGLGATRSQMVFSTAPFFGLVLSVTALGEALTGVQVMAAALMAASLAVLFSERHAHTHRHHFLSHQHRHRHDGRHHNHRHDGQRLNENHVHRHEHFPEEHVHEHWPDLHHRHNHDRKKK